uniref:TLR4 interactor with leucine rich repeats n=1 Tax=Equus asinus asinus TaxID=83772 RepID=A0A8C4KPB0_EQUAS
MEAARAVRFLFVVCGCLALPPRAEPVCPERCDCQHPQHLLCTNRGLRAVPKTSSLPSPQDVLTYSLGGNFITNITAFDFHRLGQLRRLDLQYNQIRFLHPKTFEKLSRLEELYLGNNLLQALAPGTLAPLRKLRILYANGNEIGRLSRGSFEGLESLVKLRLDGNALGALPDAVFAPLGNLLYLHLESNRLRFLGKNAFAQLGKLRFLNLSANELQPSLRHAATFAPLRSLSTLILSANSLQHLGPRVFQHLPRLGLLSLRGNQLTHLAPEAFWGLEALRELRLEGNRLSQLPMALLEPLHSLEALDLSGNELSALHPTIFGHLGRLRELSLRDNALSALSGDIFAASPALYRLDLDGNGWTCDCRLRGLKRWMGDWHSQGRLLTVFVQCRHPPALRGKYLDYLDDQQLQNGSCADPSPSVSPTAFSKPRPSPTAAGKEMAPPAGGLAKELPPQPQQRGRFLPGVTWDGAARELLGNRSALRLSRRGPGLQQPGPSAAAAPGPAPHPLDLLEKPERGRPTPANPVRVEPTPTAAPPSAPPPAGDPWQRAAKQRLVAKQQESAVQSDGGVGLPGNELSALHPTIFGHLGRLRELSLRDNALSALSGDIFAASPALYRLDLDGNGWTCDCRLRGLKRWMGDWHSQGRLLTVFVQCRHPPALRGKYLDYLDDQQLQNGSCADPSPSVSPTAFSKPRPSPTAAGKEMAPPAGGLAKELPPQPQQRGRFLPGVTWDGAARELLGNRSALRLSRRGPGLQQPGPSAAAAPGPAPHPLDLLEKPERGRPTPANPVRVEPTPTAAPPSAPPPAGDPWQRAAKQRLVAKQQESAVQSDGGVGLPPLVSDPCDFNKFILCNLTVEAVGTDSASVRWAVREHRSPRPLGGARFRLLFDRFGQQAKFHRFVYLPERSDSATLRELRGDTPYLVCVEGVLGGRVCPVAPRDHCAGLVTLPEPGSQSSVDYQMLTLALLAVNALLVLLALVAWASRWLRRKLRARRKGGAPVHVRHMYSTRRPLRSMGTGVSADFSGFQSHRPRATVCALSEADLIEFPCDRFMESSGGGAGGSLRREDHLLQRFAD